MMPKRVTGSDTESRGDPSFLRAGEEWELARGLAARDERAWRDFLDVYGDTLYSHIYYTLRRHNFRVTREEVDDSLQDLFEKLLEDGGRRLLSYEGREKCSFGSWLRVVCVNHALGLIRRRTATASVESIGPEKTHQLLEKQGLEAPDSPRETADREASIRTVERAVRGFPPRERVVFSLYYRDERSRREIAALLQIKPNHVDQILYRVREKIRNTVLGGKTV
jgi:RNA polymerase sigma-70 factor (ECF subfamily)